MTTTNDVKDNSLAASAEAFEGAMDILAAFVAKSISKNTLAKLKWTFHLGTGDFRRRKGWAVYGFLNFTLPDRRNGTIVAGISDASRYAFDGAHKVLAENIELEDLPGVTGDLVADLMGQLGLAKLYWVDDVL